MTLSDLRNTIWDALGKPTDLDPDIDTQYDGGPLLNFYVNEGQRRIACWKDPVLQRRVRIQSLFATLNYSSTIASDTVAAVNNTTFPYTVTLSSSVQNDDQYNDWVLVINSEVVKVMDYAGSTRVCTIHDTFATTPSVSDSVDLYKSFDLLLNSGHDWVAQHINLPATTDIYRADGNLLEVLSITDLTNGRLLRPAGQREKYVNNIESYGDPTEWYRYGNRIMYNYNVDSNIWFRMEYYRTPMDMSAGTDTPEIPEVYHYAIALWGIWHGLIRTTEASAAQLAWRNLVNYMRTTFSQKSVESERIHAGGTLLNDWKEF